MLNFIAGFIGCILGNIIADKILNKKGEQYNENNRTINNKN